MFYEDNEDLGRRERKSLLKKYDIPLNHLDFGYIKDLKNIRELEKIYKILKSSETGHYPDLMQCAEDRLKDLSPNNRLLRKCVPATSKDHLFKSERNSYLKEIENWKANMEMKEALLKNCTKSNHVTQPVRRTTDKIVSSEVDDADKKEERIKSFDYKSWETYDADKECLRIDLEEEKRQEELEKMERIELENQKATEKLSLEEAEINAIRDSVDALTPEEREMMSFKEKDIGNEYYKTHHLDKALKHYTRSVFIYPTVSNHNNRAATYLKQCEFTKALADLNIALQMDPDNVKARYRRAVAYQHKNEFRKALEDIRVVLSKEPSHVLARHLADRLREDCSSLPKTHRLKVKDEDGAAYMEEVVEQEMLTDYKDKEFIEINEFGLPKIMCNCNGKFTNEPGIRHEDNMRFQHIRQRKQFEQPCFRQASSSSTNQPPILPVNGPDMKPALAGGGRRLKIVELDSIYEDSEESPTSACVVRDMRSTKDVKTTANLHIAQTVSCCSGVGELDKSDKTAWNQNVKGFEVEGEEEKGKVEEELAEKIEEKLIQEQNVSTVCEVDIPRRADIIGMMGSIDDLPQTNFETNCERSDKDTWNQQWLQHSVSSVDNDFGKHMHLNESLNPKVGDGDVILKDTCGCTLSKESLKPQNFLEMWEEVNPKLVDAIQVKVNLLKGICPVHLPEVFSLNLNEEILTDLLQCMCHFYEFDQLKKENLLDYVQAVTRLKRFNIIICFVSGEVKSRLRNVLTKLSPQAEQLFKMFR